MQGSGGNDAMAWNRYYNDSWQGDGAWNGWKNPSWYEQPTDGTTMPGYDAYGSSPWNGSSTMSNGFGAGQAQAPVAGLGAGGQPSRPARKPANALSFDALRALQGDDGSDDSESEGPRRRKNHGLDQESTSASGRGIRISGASDSDDEGERGDRRIGKEATQEEKDEAESVVRKAFADNKERNRLRTQVGGASKDDLQAMLNSRIGKK